MDTSAWRGEIKADAVNGLESVQKVNMGSVKAVKTCWEIQPQVFTGQIQEQNQFLKDHKALHLTGRGAHSRFITKTGQKITEKYQ